MSSIQRISTIIIYIIGGISVILAGLYYFGGNLPETIGTTLVEKRFTNVALIWSVILFIIAAVATILFSIINVFTNRKAVKNFLIVVAIAVLLIVISYVMASSEPLPDLNMEKVPSPMAIKLVGTGLIATGILAAIAFFSIIASEVYRATK